MSSILPKAYFGTGLLGARLHLTHTIAKTVVAGARPFSTIKQQAASSSASSSSSPSSGLRSHGIWGLEGVARFSAARALPSNPGSSQRKKEILVAPPQEKEVEVQPVAAADQEFEEFPLNPKLIQRLREVGYTKPFPIQSATFPYTLENRDVIARAFTGSGKTLAFTLPIIQKLAYGEHRLKFTKNPLAIVLSPTRELGLQIYNEIEKISSNIQCLAVYGGSSIESQIRSLRKGVHVIVGTPGRVNDLIERGELNLSEIQVFVLDEADQMMGNDFKDQVELILEKTPETRQTILFSATLPRSVKSLTKNFMKNPEIVDLLQNGVTVPKTVKHLGVPMRPGQGRFRAIGDLLAVNSQKKGIIFCNRKFESSKLALYLTSRGIAAEALHSDLSQSQREKTMQHFRSGQIRILTATDVAARGIDVADCDLVLHTEPPSNGFEYYIHRSGRTGRAGKDGTSIVLYARSDRDFLFNLDKSGIELEDISLPKEEEIIAIAVQSQLSKMRDIPKHMVDKVTPTIKELFEKEGITALAKALILSSKVSAGSEYEEEDMGRKSRFDRGDRDDRSFGSRSSFGGGDRDRSRPSFGGGDRDRRSSFGGGDRDRRSSFGFGDRDRSSSSSSNRGGSSRSFGGRKDRESGY